MSTMQHVNPENDPARQPDKLRQKDKKQRKTPENESQADENFRPKL